jgi:hypothetical protein
VVAEARAITVSGSMRAPATVHGSLSTAGGLTAISRSATMRATSTTLSPDQDYSAGPLSPGSKGAAAPSTTTASGPARSNSLALSAGSVPDLPVPRKLNISRCGRQPGVHSSI